MPAEVKELTIVKILGVVVPGRNAMRTADIKKIVHGQGDFAGQHIVAVIEGDVCKRGTGCDWCDKLRDWMKKYRKA